LDSLEWSQVKEKAPYGTFSDDQILREKTGHRTVVLVRVSDRVRVELDLAVVEVEVQSAAEATVRIRIFAFVCPFTEA
jgi:hypothetical protein